MTRGPAPLLLLALAACSSAASSVGNRLDGPTAAVPFVGVANKGAGLRDYLAVTSSRGDELRFVDPSDERPVLGPGLVFPLAIPTAPRPLLVAAASLGDGGADLLVAVSAGAAGLLLPGPVLQVVDTWSGLPRVAFEVPLEAALGLEASILTVAGAPVPTTGRARLLVGASGGRLAVVELARDPATGGLAAASAAVTVQVLGFDPADLAFAPGGSLLFIATGDPIPGPRGAVRGVAQLDTAGSPPWAVTALDARAGTVAVAADRVRERLVPVQDDPTAVDPNGPERFLGGPDIAMPLQVYATLDTATCGPSFPIDCGVVTLLPNTGLAPDPLGNDPFRAPMQVPGLGLSIAIFGPPASGDGRILNDPYNPGVPLQLTAPGSGQRNTSRVAAVGSSDGRVYLLDLGRWGPMNDVSLLRSTTRTRVTSAGSFGVTTDPTSPDSGKTNGLGLWTDFPAGAAAEGTAPAVTVSGASLPAFIQVTPGFTDQDDWRVSWQGALPRLSQRPSVALLASTGDVYVGVQSDTGNADPRARWLVGAEVASPELGIRLGDIVELPEYACGSDEAGRSIRSESTVAEVVAGTAAAPLAIEGVSFPGGALRLARSATLCAPLAAGRPLALLATVRAQGLLLTGAAAGYAGRPGFDAPYALEGGREDLLSGEALLLARKVRRRFYPTDPPCPELGPGCYAGFPWLADPLAPGPAVAFKVGIVDATGATLSGADPGAVAGLPRDASVTFSTQSGLSPTFRRPRTGGASPGRALPIDRTRYAGHENDATRVYVPFLDDQLVSFSVSESIADVVSLR